MTDTALGGVFFIVGAQRCGTSLLRRLLDEHPGIEMAKPFVPETKWFLRDDHPHGIDPFLETLFVGGPSVRWYGEKATSYLEHADVARRLDREIPRSRVVAVLRDPVERAISNYAYSVDNGVETRPIEVALDPDTVEPSWSSGSYSVSPFAYLRRGRYVDYLPPYLELFGDRMQILFFDELVRGDGLDQLLTWLGLGPTPHGGPPRRVNASEHSAPPLPTRLRQKLDSYFAEPNDALSKMLGRDLTSWTDRPRSDDG